jgi:hypothetical protein
MTADNPYDPTRQPAVAPPPSHEGSFRGVIWFNTVVAGLFAVLATLPLIRVVQQGGMAAAPPVALLVGVGIVVLIAAALIGLHRRQRWSRWILLPFYGLLLFSAVRLEFRTSHGQPVPPAAWLGKLMVYVVIAAAPISLIASRLFVTPDPDPEDESSR